MAESRFVYVTYIKARPENVWEALTTPAFIKKYWFGITAESEWRAGSDWKLKFEDGRVADTGTIAVSDPPRRLVIDWLNEFVPEMKVEGHSRCEMTLEPAGAATKLTVTHSMARDRSKLIDAVSNGWPEILSNLKSLLETGSVAVER